MSVLPGRPKSGSARGLPSKYLHFKSKGMGWSGRSHITQGTTIAVILNFFEGIRTADILRLGTSWRESYERDQRCLKFAHLVGIVEMQALRQLLRYKGGWQGRVKNGPSFHRGTIRSINHNTTRHEQRFERKSSSSIWHDRLRCTSGTNGSWCITLVFQV